MWVYNWLKSWSYRFMPAIVLKGVQRWHYLRVLRSFSISDELDLPTVLRLVRPGDTVVDVGANIGVYTKVLSKAVGREGSVLSIEPVAQTFAILANNINALKLANVRLRNVAVSSVSSDVVMTVPRTSSGILLHYQARIASVPDDASPSRATERVRCETLDRLLENQNKITFIKCDVEGHELECIAGARRVIERFSPAWLIEVSGNPQAKGSRAAEVFALMAASGYTPWVVENGTVNRYRPGTLATNYFFLTAEQAAMARA
jgi:FkbM family methyltransferase